MGQKLSQPRVRYPSFRRRAIVRPCRGTIVVQKWPAKRRGPRNATNQWWTEWLRQADILWQYLPPLFKQPAYDAARGNPQMPRDLHIAASAGRLWFIDFTDGKRAYPMAAARDVSASLDVLTLLHGALIYRGPDIWLPVVGENDGDVLAWNALTQQPEYREQQAPPGLYTPPNVADFPIVLGTPPPTLATSPAGPLVMRTPATTSFTRCRGVFRALEAAPTNYVLGLRAAVEAVANRRWGIALRDSATGRLITFNYWFAGATTAPYLQILRWTNESSPGVAPLSRNIAHSDTLFLRIRDSGTNFYYDVSADDANYATIYSESRTAWLANPNQFGFVLVNGAAENFDSTLAALHFTRLAYV